MILGILIECIVIGVKRKKEVDKTLETERNVKLQRELMKKGERKDASENY